MFAEFRGYGLNNRAIPALVVISLLVYTASSQTNTWTQTGGPGTGYDVRSFTANSLGHVFAETWTDGSTWKTTDNGSTWSRCAAIPDPNPVLALCADPRDRIFAAVYTSGVFRSTDGGGSWQMKNSGLANLAVRGLLVDDSAYLWVTTEGGLFCSTDAGDAWVLKRSGAFTAVLLDSAHAIVSEDHASLLRSLNHGNTWTATPRAGSVSLGGVHPDGSYYASSSTSGIYRSTDFGVSWTDMHSGVSWSGYTDAFTFSSGGVIYYARDGEATGILVSRDGGKTWSLWNDGLTTARIIPLFRAPGGYVFIGTNGAGVFRSRVPADESAAGDGGRMHGTGDGAHTPRIRSITPVPESAALARIVWDRCLDDSDGAADRTTQYSIWRRVHAAGDGGPAWDFVTSVPAIGIPQYAADVPLRAPAFPDRWDVFMVAATTSTMQGYRSAPDSVRCPVRR